MSREDRERLDHEEPSARIEQKLEQHDARFDQHDERFDRIEQKLEQHDARFDQHDARFDRIEHKLEQHDEQFHRVELKLEKIESDIHLVLEGMHLGFESLRRSLQSQIDDLKARLDLVELIVRQNNRDLTSALTAIQESSSELRELRAAIDRIDGKLDEKADRAQVEALERRVAALESEVLGQRS